MVVLDLRDSIVQEADSDDALPRAEVLDWRGADLRIDLDVPVELRQVLHALVVPIELDNHVHEEARGAARLVVCGPDEALVGIGEEIWPVLRRIDPETLELLLVVYDAQESLVDAEPVVVRGHIGLAHEVRGVLRQIGAVEQLLARDDVVGIGRAAEPDVVGGSSGLRLDQGLRLAGREMLVVDLDIVELVEVRSCCLQVLLAAGAEHRDRALCLRCLDKVRPCTDRVGCGRRRTRG